MKTYRILTLGASGSGKTVFLASMFKQLSIQGEAGFFLGANNHQEQKILNSVYTVQIFIGIDTKFFFPRKSIDSCSKN